MKFSGVALLFVLFTVIIHTSVNGALFDICTKEFELPGCSAPNCIRECYNKYSNSQTGYCEINPKNTCVCAVTC
ncbi:hypothetical protein ACHQM5_022346 [Ranunculus cassubicifolius]